MRRADVEKCWKEVYGDPKRYSNFIKKLTMNDITGHELPVDLCPGITAICGLNGAGKSSFVASIKELLGVEIPSIISKNKFNTNLSAEVIIDRVAYTVNAENNAISFGLKSELCKYIDSDLAIAALKYWDQQNIDELLESISENQFSADQLDIVSDLVGKRYTECISYEIDEEVLEEDSFYSPVFFKVNTDGIEYDSTSMGIGEHFIFYVFYMLETIAQDSILIIEEPESYISVLSQQKLMDYIAKVIAKKRISVIITTHSPHILRRIKADHIRILFYNAGNIELYVPSDIEDAKRHLGIEYSPIENGRSIATVFVEDAIARLFILRVLEDENPILAQRIDVVFVGGHPEITSRLSYNDSAHMSHRFVGVYDKDVASMDDFKKDKIKWPYLFLPIDDCVELEIMRFFKDKNTRAKLTKSLKIKEALFDSVLSKWDGEDHHEWFMNICSDLGVEREIFIKEFYAIWKKSHKRVMNKFVSDFLEAINCKQDSRLLQKQYTCKV